MANSVTTQVLEDGPENVVIRVEGVLDTSDLASTVIVDPANYGDIGPYAGLKASKLRIKQTLFNVADGLSVNLFWDASTPVRVQELVGRGQHNHRPAGGLQNNASSPTGRITLTTTGWSTGKIMSFVLYLVMGKQGASFVVTTPAGATMALGMNMAGLTTFAGAIPFANLCTLGVAWVKTGTGTVTYSELQGVITVTAITGTVGFTMGIATTGSSQHLPAGTYTILNPNGYTVSAGSGQGASDYLAATTNTQPTFTLGTDASLFLNISNITANGTYATGLACIIPNHLASYQAGDVFNADFVNYHTVMKSTMLRAMDWAATNTNIDTDWSDRSVTGQVTFNTSASSVVPWEYVIAAANRIGCDIWVNVPIRATQAYVNSMAAFFAANLNSNLRVRVETGNEVVFNQSSVFAAGYNWVRYSPFTKINCTVDASTGNITSTAHGLSNGNIVSGWVTRTTRLKQISDSATSNSFYVARGVNVYVQVVDVNTFKVFTDAGFTSPILWPTGVTDWIYVNTGEAGKSTVQETNYAALVTRNWAAFDSAMGANRVLASIGSQSGNASKTQAVLAASGVAARVNSVHVAPYFQHVFWWGGEIEVSSGIFRPKVWCNANSANMSGMVATFYVSVYATGSNPRLDQRKAGTGTGFVALKTGNTAYGVRKAAPTTISVATPAVVTIDAQAPTANNTVVFTVTGGTMPTGLSAGTTYFVVNPSGTTFNVAATSGGAAIATTAAGTGTITADVSYGTSSYAYFPDLAVVNTTVYDVYMDIVDSIASITSSVKQTITASVTTSMVDFLDSYTNQARRCVVAMDWPASGYSFYDTTAVVNAIAGSAAPNTQLVNYEGAMSIDETAPTPVANWMWTAANNASFTEDQTFGDILRHFVNGLAKRGVKQFMYFTDVSSRSLSWSAADSYSDTVDKRFIALSSFKGAVPIQSGLDGSDKTGNTVASDPGNFPTPTTIATFASGPTYSILSGDDEGNFQMSSNVLQMIGGTNVVWNNPTQRTLLLQTSSNDFDELFHCKFVLGNSWFEADANFALDMTTQSVASALSLKIPNGGSLPLTSGTGGTFSGGYLNIGTSAYGSSTALTAAFAPSTPFLIAFAGNIGSLAAPAQILQVSASAFISCKSWSANTAVWRWYAGTGNDFSSPNITYNTTNAVHWFYTDGNGNCTMGHNQITDATFTQTTAGAAIALSRDFNLYASNDTVGSVELISRSGMTLSNALAMVQKIQNLHSIP